MDYQEEQSSEIEALESIYEGDIKVLALEPQPVFVMPVKTEGGLDSGENNDCIRVFLKMTLTPKYPEEVPLIEILDQDPEDDSSGRNDDDSDDDEEVNKLDEHDLRDPLIEHLKETAEENLGMVMGFTIISAATEWLTDKWEAIRQQQADEKERIKQLEEEAEKKRLEGTKVTVESFMAWKRQFDEERLAMMAKVKKEELGLTGKEQFLNNADIDLAPIGDGGGEVDLGGAAAASVEVDESLFEDLDDLDVGDSDLDDSDADSDR